jgi:hypothetical protein
VPLEPACYRRDAQVCAANKTTATERNVHAGFLRAGLELLTAESEEEDGLF